jgi:hypothetical protein
MKKISIVYYAIFTLLISSVVIAQPSMQEPSQTEYISNRTVNLMDNPNDYTGSPYYNVAFLKGSILSKGKTIASNQILRYNVSKEEFEIRDSRNQESKIVKTVLRNKDITIQIGDESFEYISSAKNKLRGYFIPLFKGGKNSLYKKITKKYIASQKAINSMASDIAAFYKEKEILYLVDNKGTYTELSSSKKGKLKAFGDMKKNVKDYTKQNKLNLNKEKDLIKVVTYVNSI